MKKFLATAGAVAVLALTRTPALAASARRPRRPPRPRSIKPLTIAKTQDLDFGMVVLAGASFAGEVGHDQPRPARDLRRGGVNVTCSGAPTAAKFHLVGNEQCAGDRQFAVVQPDRPGNAGVTPTRPARPSISARPAARPASTFDLGGSITLASTTPGRRLYRHLDGDCRLSISLTAHSKWGRGAASAAPFSLRSRGAFASHG